MVAIHATSSMDTPRIDAEIDLSIPSPYLPYFQKNGLVWARARGQQYWPAKILEWDVEKHLISVDFLHSPPYRGHIDFLNIHPFLGTDQAEFFIRNSAKSKTKLSSDAHATISQIESKNVTSVRRNFSKSGKRFDLFGLQRLVVAAEVGLFADLEALLQTSVNVNATNCLGMTALMYAAKHGHAESVKLLLANGAAKSIDYQTVAKGRGGINIGQTALMLASAVDNKEVVNLLLAYGPNSDLKDHEGCTAFFSACRNGFMELTRIFIERGASVNIEVLRGEVAGMTPLMFACQYGRYEMVKYLLENKAETDPVDKDGDCALLCAITHNLRIADDAVLTLPVTTPASPSYVRSAAESVACCMVTLLLSYKANPNIRNNRGETPLMHAATRNWQDVLTLLLNAGARKDIKNSKGKLAYDYVSNSVEYMLEMLKVDGMDAVEQNDDEVTTRTSSKRNKKEREEESPDEAVAEEGGRGRGESRRRGGVDKDADSDLASPDRGPRQLTPTKRNKSNSSPVSAKGENSRVKKRLISTIDSVKVTPLKSSKKNSKSLEPTSTDSPVTNGSSCPAQQPPASARSADSSSSHRQSRERRVPGWLEESHTGNNLTIYIDRPPVTPAHHKEHHASAAATTTHHEKKFKSPAGKNKSSEKKAAISTPTPTADSTKTTPSKTNAPTNNNIAPSSSSAAAADSSSSMARQSAATPSPPVSADKSVVKMEKEKVASRHSAHQLEMKLAQLEAQRKALEKKRAREEFLKQRREQRLEREEMEDARDAEASRLLKIVQQRERLNRIRKKDGEAIEEPVPEIPIELQSSLASRGKSLLGKKTSSLADLHKSGSKTGGGSKASLQASGLGGGGGLELEWMTEMTHPGGMGLDLNGLPQPSGTPLSPLFKSQPGLSASQKSLSSLNLEQIASATSSALNSSSFASSSSSASSLPSSTSHSKSVSSSGFSAQNMFQQVTEEEPADGTDDMMTSVFIRQTSPSQSLSTLASPNIDLNVGALLARHESFGTVDFSQSSSQNEQLGGLFASPAAHLHPHQVDVLSTERTMQDDVDGMANFAALANLNPLGDLSSFEVNALDSNVALPLSFSPLPTPTATACAKTGEETVKTEVQSDWMDVFE